MNSITLTGNLTADIELKNTNSGISVCSYSLGVRRPKVKDTTDFINCVTWRQGAEYLGKYAHKGDTIAVTGTLTSRKFQDRSGNNRVAYEVSTDTVEIIKHAGEGNAQQKPNVQYDAPQGGQTALNGMMQGAQAAGVPVQQTGFAEVIDEDLLPF